MRPVDYWLMRVHGTATGNLYLVFDRQSCFCRVIMILTDNLTSLSVCTCASVAPSVRCSSTLMLTRCAARRPPPCSGGELFDRICAKGSYFERDAASVSIELARQAHSSSQADRVQVVHTITSAVAYLHGLGIVVSAHLRVNVLSVDSCSVLRQHRGPFPFQLCHVRHRAERQTLQ